MKIKYLLFLFGVFISPPIYATWDTSTPSGTEAKSLGDDRIRELKTDIQTALNTYGVFPGTDTANPKYLWTIGSGATASRPTSVSTGTIFVNTSSGCVERYMGVSDGWRCIQTVSSLTPISVSSMVAIINSTTVYVPGQPNAVLYLRNDGTDTNQMFETLRFKVGNADDVHFSVIRDTISTDSADLLVNVRQGGTQFQPQRWESDGTILFNSSNTFNGISVFNSSVTFNKQVVFSSTTLFTGKIAFFSTMTATQSNLPAGSATTVNFNSEQFDYGGNFTASTFTAPVNGIYQFNVCLRLNDIDAAAYTQLRTVLFTSNDTYDYNISDTPANQISECFSNVVDMEAGDIAYVQFNPVGGSTIDILHVNGTSIASWFSGFKVD